MNVAIIGTLVRSAGIAIGTYLASKGIIESGSVTAIVDQGVAAFGAVMTFGMAVWGVVQKVRAGKQ